MPVMEHNEQHDGDEDFRNFLQKHKLDSYRSALESEGFEGNCLVIHLLASCYFIFLSIFSI